MNQDFNQNKLIPYRKLFRFYQENEIFWYHLIPMYHFEIIAILYNIQSYISNNLESVWDPLILLKLKKKIIESTVDKGKN